LFRIGDCGILYLFVNRASSVFEGFTQSPFSIVHSDSILSLAVIRLQSVCGYFPLKIMATSSAYATTLQPPPSRIRSSLFNAIFYRSGDSTPPCGVPLFTSLVWVEVPSVAVTILLNSNCSVRDSVIAMGSTLLKAPSMSRKAISVYSLMPSYFSMLLTSRCSGDSVDLPLVKRVVPSVGSIVALMCRLTILSKLLSRNNVRRIGLKSFDVVWVSFPALGMKTTFVSCHAVRSSPTAHKPRKPVTPTIFMLDKKF